MFSQHLSLRHIEFTNGRQISLQQRHKTQKLSVVCHASLNPYKTLGISDGSSDNDVRRAYRKLVLKYHPDVSAEVDSERRFKEIQMAYEILTGKDMNSVVARDGSQGESWDFHDWYWSFSMRKRRSRAAMDSDSCGGTSGGGGGNFNAEGSKTQVRSQLAGLKKRASVRRMQEQFQESTSTTSNTASQQEESPPNIEEQPKQERAAQEVDFADFQTQKQGLFRLLGLLGFIITSSFKSVNYLPVLTERIQTTKNNICYGHAQFAKYLLSTYLQPFLDPFALLLSDYSDSSIEHEFNEVVNKRLLHFRHVKSMHMEGQSVQHQLPNLHFSNINNNISKNEDVNERGDDDTIGQQREYSNAQSNQFRQDTSSVSSQLAGLKRRAAIKERGV